MRLFIQVPEACVKGLLEWAQAERRYPRQQVEWILVQALRQHAIEAEEAFQQTFGEFERARQMHAASAEDVP